MTRPLFHGEQNKSEVLKRVEKASPHRRRYLINRLMGKRLQKKLVNDIPEWTRELALERVREVYEKRGRISHVLLNEFHKKRPELYPSSATVFQLFKEREDVNDGWNNMLKELGLPPRTHFCQLFGKPPKDDVSYYVYLYRDLGLTTRELYKEARRKYPEVVPAYVYLAKNLGGYTALRRLARLDSCSEQLEALLKLMHDLGGRWPKKKKCREHSIDRGYLEQRFGGRQALKSMCLDILRFERPDPPPPPKPPKGLAFNKKKRKESPDEERTRDHRTSTTDHGSVSSEVHETKEPPDVS